MTGLYKFERPVFFLVFALALWSMKPGSESSYTYQGDDLRYMSYAVSLDKYGVFGLLEGEADIEPPSGNANAPLYPALLWAGMMLDQDFTNSLTCLVDVETRSGCDEHFETFFVIQVFLGVVSLFLIYLLAVQLSRDRIIGWIAAVLAFGSGIFTEFAYLFMTEILIFPVFAGLLITCLKFYESKKLFWAVGIGILLAVLTLIRPSYLYLFYGFVLFFVVLAFLRRDKALFFQFVILVMSFILIVSPWALRNKINFNSFALTTGDYAEAVLVQRVNYNQMTWPEVGVAMIYWLPDFGDSLAGKIFPEQLYEKLGWGPGTYYAQHYGQHIKELSEDLGGKDKILGHLIKHEVLTFKHIVVSIPLALRGTFIAKYWGLVGFIAFIALLIGSLRNRDFKILILSLPLLYMVAFHAGLSVSIPRYNLPLITLYALSMAWYIKRYAACAFEKFKHE